MGRRNAVRARRGVRYLRPHDRPGHPQHSLQGRVTSQKTAAVVKQGITPGVQSGTAGSSPASRSNRLSLGQISGGEAKKFMRRWHYKKTASTGRYYAGFDAQGLAAVAVVKGLSGGNGKSRFQLEGLTTKELSRLALRDDCPKNSESMFLAQLAGAGRQDGIDLILAYADPVVGHAGTIYKASNFVYLGRSYYSYKTHAFLVDGEEISLAGMRKIGTTAERIVHLRNTYGNRFEIRRSIPKHVYILPLTRKARKEVSARLASDGDRYDRHSGAWGWFTPRGRGFGDKKAVVCECIYVTGKSDVDCTACRGKTWLWIPRA